ncbi:DNA/RNA helicase domain-containing protein [Streptomyces seoulensis]|uniref:DNA/RNA helicase domain-containing protein n=1 Tax=Streptomyces seoulensis TaxID=73044 RepID=UPI003C2DCAD0
MSMLLLRLSARDLLALNARRRLVPHLADRWVHFGGGESSEGERAAWAESLVSLAEDLMDAERGNVEMIVECSPTTDKGEESCRSGLIDVVLVGRHPAEGTLSVQLVEMKQWSSVTRVEAATSELVYVPGYDDPVEHPALQLSRYHALFTGPTGLMNGLRFECGGFAYLHNATDESVLPLLGVDAPTGPYAHVYTRDSRSRLLKDLQRHFTTEDDYSAAEYILHRMELRNTPLLDAMVNSNGEDTVFTLRGRQKDVAREVLAASELILDRPGQKALVPHPKRAVFLITGGAGTGKSAIGLQMRADLEAAGRTVKYASGSRAFNSAIKEYVGYTEPEFRERFGYFNSFVHAPDPPLDVLICDEAHRLRDMSRNRHRPAAEQGTKPQVDELLDASRVTVFFLDAGQTVRPHEVGTVELIEDAARRRDVALRRYGLVEQYRCGGSDAYVRWVRALLGLSTQPVHGWVPDGLMHIEVVDTPEEMESIIGSEFRAGATARMVAGYCWPWSKPDENKNLEDDVRIGDWHRPWNASSESFCAKGEPPSRIWPVHDDGIGQIGCVYTAQGLEWDWCGVIMGDDMVWRTNRWVFQRGKQRKDPETGVKRVAKPGSLDPKVRTSTLDDDEFARCVRNAYHVLLTRASRATVLYSTDEETRQHLRRLVGETDVQGLRPTLANMPPELRIERQHQTKRSRRERKALLKAKLKNEMMLF